MSSFFKAGDAPDAAYCTIRDGVEDRHVRGRDHIEKLWAAGREFVDADAADKATRDLPSVYWELALSNAFLSAGLSVARRRDLDYKNNKGPDLFVEGEPGVWVEAVAIRPGIGRDALQTPEPMVAYSYEPDGVVLRLRHAIRDKSAKLKDYRSQGIIKPSHASVIAISGLLLPFRFIGSTPPEIVRAVYPVNHLVLEMDRTTGRVTGQNLQYRDRVTKLSGAEVETDIFLNPEFSHVSAVLFAECCWFHQAEPPGADFQVVHNFAAQTPLLDGWIAAGEEYWWRTGGESAKIEMRRPRDST